MLAAAFLPFALPSALTFVPAWILALVVALLVAAAIVARWRGDETVNEWTGYLILVLLTTALVYGLVTLVLALPRHAETPGALLRSAIVLWLANVLVFASWYWRLDAGGPNERDQRPAHTRGAFLFPQMALLSGPDGQSVADAEGWQPGFIDYLFLAFNTSTAFSPTDTPVMSRWAKLAMIVQAIISFTTVALLAARAVNIL